ncbi:MAG: RsmB/NOP family class I SAM-dependent RNA methyltransferase [Nanoarchaeota archaeon]
MDHNQGGSMSKQEFFDRYKQLGQTPRDIVLHPTIRVNTLKILPNALISRLTAKGFAVSKIPWLRYGYDVRLGKQSIGSTTEYLMGYYYTQEAAAQLPVQVLDPQSGELVLDMCAAPGGKTTQISQWMQNTGTILALDKSFRLYSLKNNLERTSAGNIIIYKKDARFATDFGMIFNKILLDAPCTGNFVGDNTWFEKRALNDIRSRARLQKELIKAAAKILAPGGTLVYSTCSLEPEENEMIIDYILNKDTQLRLLDTGIEIGDPGLTSPFEKPLHQDIKKCTRLWPWNTNTQGFFIAKLTRT